ncbi:hypothetical protein [Litchfieldella rifensis]|uniref:Secreted protein n=1 Tax=Litchfieldella rifensis TaxID=762643 RepID=A0ABV7LQN4_9GAMM
MAIEVVRVHTMILLMWPPLGRMSRPYPVLDARATDGMPLLRPDDDSPSGMYAVSVVPPSRTEVVDTETWRPMPLTIESMGSDTHPLYVTVTGTGAPDTVSLPITVQTVTHARSRTEAHRIMSNTMPMPHARVPAKDDDPMAPLEAASHDTDLHSGYRHYPVTGREHDWCQHLTGLGVA